LPDLPSGNKMHRQMTIKYMEILCYLLFNSSPAQT